MQGKLHLYKQKDNVKYNKYLVCAITTFKKEIMLGIPFTHIPNGRQEVSDAAAHLCGGPLGQACILSPHR